MKKWMVRIEPGFPHSLLRETDQMPLNHEASQASIGKGTSWDQDGKNWLQVVLWPPAHMPWCACICTHNNNKCAHLQKDLPPYRLLIHVAEGPSQRGKPTEVTEKKEVRIQTITFL